MYDGVMPTQSDLRAQVTRLNLVLDEHIQLIQEAILEKDVRFAKKNIRQAREDIGVLSIQIGKMQRAIRMLHSLMRDRATSEDELLDILLTMKTAETLIMRSAFDESALQLERLIEHLLANSAALNPFIFFQFWMGIEARWEANSDQGQLLVRIENTSDVVLPGFNIKAPVPPNWRVLPDAQPVERLQPGETMDLVFVITPSAMAAIREFGAPGSLQEKLNVQTGYDLRPDGLQMTCRVENASDEAMNDVLLAPWIPPGWSCKSWPFFRYLAPKSVEISTLDLELKK
ncbi:MAG: hypothetical protein CMA73_04685 [Euryarchaeota archaeon]|jgi:hypothetical protein|nr:hypothetical protein [Euryarchaeota archaeon]|tara:strand:- start:40 stop:900 length:861 start_codon:yes stop_codon:yes gene_type:complete